MSAAVEPEFTIACRRFIVDGIQGGVSILDVVESVYVARAPCSTLGFAVAARFRRAGDVLEPLQLPLRIVRVEEGERTVVARSDLSFPQGSSVAWAHVTFKVLRVTRTGAIGFLPEWKAEGGRWRRGPTAWVEARPLPMPEEAVDRLLRQLDDLPPLG